MIVADDGSSDGTAAMVESFAAPFRLRLLKLEQGGQAAAQNEAIEVAEGAALPLPRRRHDRLAAS